MLSELRQMQVVAFSRVVNGETEDKDVAQLMRAYVAAEQQRNVLRMRPAPKPVDVTALAKARRSRRPAAATPVSLPAPSLDAAQVPQNAPGSTPTIQ